MPDKSQTIIGYALLGLGVLLLIKALYSVYNVFTGVTLPPEMFTIEDIVLSVPGGAGSLRLLEGKQATKLADMAVWYILMFFFVTVGSKLASIGVQLLRRIDVTVKSKGENAASA